MKLALFKKNTSNLQNTKDEHEYLSIATSPHSKTRPVFVLFTLLIFIIGATLFYLSSANKINLNTKGSIFSDILNKNVVSQESSESTNSDVASKVLAEIPEGNYSADKLSFITKDTNGKDVVAYYSGFVKSISGNIVVIENKEHTSSFELHMPTRLQVYFYTADSTGAISNPKPVIYTNLDNVSVGDSVSYAPGSTIITVVHL